MSDNDLKTLREHNVQVGDVVAIYGCAPRTIKLRDGEPWIWTESDWFGPVARSFYKYRIISRANAAAAIGLTANRVAFGLLDDVTQAAFKAHVAAGGDVDVYWEHGWGFHNGPWKHHWIIRAAPKRVLGERIMYGTLRCFAGDGVPADTHRLTLPTLDGVLICGTYTGPDGAQVVIATIDGDDK